MGNVGEAVGLYYPAISFAVGVGDGEEYVSGEALYGAWETEFAARYSPFLQESQRELEGCDESMRVSTCAEVVSSAELAGIIADELCDHRKLRGIAAWVAPELIDALATDHGLRLAIPAEMLPRPALAAMVRTCSETDGGEGAEETVFALTGLVRETVPREGALGRLALKLGMFKPPSAVSEAARYGGSTWAR